jgi:hypothetical protein
MYSRKKMYSSHAKAHPSSLKLEITRDNIKYPCNNGVIGNHDIHPNKQGWHYIKPTVSMISHWQSTPSNGCTPYMDTQSNQLGSKPLKRATTWAGRFWLNAMSRSTTLIQSKLQREIWIRQEKSTFDQSKDSTIRNMQHLLPQGQESVQGVYPNVHGTQNHVLWSNRSVPYKISARQQINHGYDGNW